MKTVGVTMILAVSAAAQSLEPRLYAPAPAGFNFLVVGYGHSQGALSDNPAFELKDPTLRVETAVAVYARAFGVLGKSSKVDVIVPAVCIDGRAEYQGDTVTRSVCGPADVKARFSIDVYGAPALSLREFASYRQDTVVGISVQVTAPTGQYDAQKLVNVGMNRWALKAGAGVSKAWGAFIFELAADAEFYTTNEHFLGTHALRQDPVYSTQAHLIYTFAQGVWFGVDANYFWGGEYVNDGQGSGKKLADSRMGATLAFPVDRKNALKLYANTGVSTRTGTDFDLFGVAWQFRWAD